MKTITKSLVDKTRHLMEEEELRRDLHVFTLTTDGRKEVSKTN